LEAGDALVGYVQVAVVKGSEQHYLALGGWVARRHRGKGYSDEAAALI
jgi:RimJ/RimL family protein N-acetyltransferase